MAALFLPATVCLCAGSVCDVAQVGLVHICTFILLKLSGERNFGVALNKVTWFMHTT